MFFIIILHFTNSDPWAAHLVGEVATYVRQIPILCDNYCASFYNACQSIVMNPANPFNTTVINNKWSSSSFCNVYGNTQTGYCFLGFPYQPLSPVNQQYSSGLIFICDIDFSEKPNFFVYRVSY